jgi:competence protein ComEC
LLPEATWNRGQRLLTSGLWWLAGALGIGIAATLVSAVTGPTFFHVFTPGALATNLVLVPLAMLVITAGFASVATGLAGLVWLNSLFNHAAMLVLAGIDGLIRLGLRVPGLWWPAQWRAPWVGALALGALLAAGLAGYAWRWEARRGGWWPPVAVVALALLFGIKWG